MVEPALFSTDKYPLEIVTFVVLPALVNTGKYVETPAHVGATPVPLLFKNCPDVPALFVALTL